MNDQIPRLSRKAAAAFHRGLTMKKEDPIFTIIVGFLLVSSMGCALLVALLS